MAINICINCGVQIESKTIQKSSLCFNCFNKLIKEDEFAKQEKIKEYKSALIKLIFEDDFGYDYVFRGFIISKLIYIESLINILIKLIYKLDNNKTFEELFLNELNLNNKLKIIQKNSENINFIKFDENDLFDLIIEQFDFKNNLSLNNLMSDIEQKFNIKNNKIEYQKNKSLILKDKLITGFVIKHDDLDSFLKEIRDLIEFRNTIAHNLGEINYNDIFDSIDYKLPIITNIQKTKNSNTKIEINSEYITKLNMKIRNVISTLIFLINNLDLNNCVYLTYYRKDVGGWSEI